MKKVVTSAPIWIDVVSTSLGTWTKAALRGKAPLAKTVREDHNWNSQKYPPALFDIRVEVS